MVKPLSHSVVSDSLVTPWTIAHQAPLSIRFSRQEYWSELPGPPPGDPPRPRDPTHISCICRQGLYHSCHLGSPREMCNQITWLYTWEWHNMVNQLCVFSSLSRATPWTVARQAPLSVGFSRQEYWSGLPFLSPKSTVLWYKFFKKHKDYLRSQKSVSDTQSLCICLAVERPHIPREAHKIV